MSGVAFDSFIFIMNLFKSSSRYILSSTAYINTPHRMVPIYWQARKSAQLSPPHPTPLSLLRLSCASPQHLEVLPHTTGVLSMHRASVVGWQAYPLQLSRFSLRVCEYISNFPYPHWRHPYLSLQSFMSIVYLSGARRCARFVRDPPVGFLICIHITFTITSRRIVCTVVEPLVSYYFHSNQSARPSSE